MAPALASKLLEAGRLRPFADLLARVPSINIAALLHGQLPNLLSEHKSTTAIIPVSFSPALHS